MQLIPLIKSMNIKDGKQTFVTECTYLRILNLCVFVFAFTFIPPLSKRTPPRVLLQIRELTHEKEEERKSSLKGRIRRKKDEI